MCYIAWSIRTHTRVWFFSGDEISFSLDFQYQLLDLSHAFKNSLARPVKDITACISFEMSHLEFYFALDRIASGRGWYEMTEPFSTFVCLSFINISFMFVYTTCVSVNFCSFSPPDENVYTLYCITRFTTTTIVAFPINVLGRYTLDYLSKQSTILNQEIGSCKARTWISHLEVMGLVRSCRFNFTVGHCIFYASIYSSGCRSLPVRGWETNVVVC